MAKKKPNIRFNEFDEEWDEKQLKDAVAYQATGVRACDASDDGSYDLYDANGVIGKIDTCASEKPYISIIKDGSGVGRVRMMPEQSNILGTMGCITAKDDNDIHFIFSHLQTKDFKNHIISGAIPHVYFRDYGEDPLNTPKPIEQQKIGEFFKQLDELIGAKEEELEKLRQIKLALLDKMFPSDSQDVTNTPPHWNSLNINKLCKDLVMTGAAPNIPAIRFRGFTEPWEKDLFGKRLKAMPYKQFIKTPEPLGKYPIIQQGEEPLLGKANGLPIEDYANKVVFGDHTVSLYMPTSPFFVATDGVRIFSIDNMSQQLLYVILEKYKPISHGYTRHTSYLYENHYYYPSSTIEQQKICDFFRSQDDAISNSQEQIIKLKYIKQACMQQMFA